MYSLDEQALIERTNLSRGPYHLRVVTFAMRRTADNKQLALHGITGLHGLIRGRAWASCALRIGVEFL